MKINPFKVLVFVSIGFLLYYLVSSDIFQIPKVQFQGHLILSIILLFVAFLMEGVMWKQILKTKLSISYSDALGAVGLSVFAKYIPGKVLIILGRADYIRKKYDYPIKELVGRSFDAQILVIFSGLLLGSISILTFNAMAIYVWYVVAGIILLGFFLFTSYLHTSVERIANRLFKKKIKIPKLSLRDALFSLPVFLLYWLIMSSAFYFFVSAFTVNSPEYIFGFILPLAIAFGIVVIIAPGGIGVRESVLAGLMHMGGMEIELATSIAVVSRLWFVIGEAFIFVLGVILDRFSKKVDTSNKLYM